MGLLTSNSLLYTQKTQTFLYQAENRNVPTDLYLTIYFVCEDIIFVDTIISRLRDFMLVESPSFCAFICFLFDGGWGVVDA